MNDRELAEMLGRMIGGKVVIGAMQRAMRSCQPKSKEEQLRAAKEYFEIHAEIHAFKTGDRIRLKNVIVNGSGYSRDDLAETFFIRELPSPVVNIDKDGAPLYFNCMVLKVAECGCCAGPILALLEHFEPYHHNAIAEEPAGVNAPNAATPWRAPEPAPADPTPDDVAGLGGAESNAPSVTEAA